MSDTPLNFTAGKKDIRFEGGDDLSLVVTLPYNTTAGTHEFQIATTPNGTASKTVTTVADSDGNVITVGSYSGGETPATIHLESGYTITLTDQVFYYRYQVTLSGSVRTYLKGSLKAE